MSPTVCLVIPARNAARTLRPCLTAAVTILDQGQLARIIVVDDGSTDETAGIAAEFPVTCLRSPPSGRSGARNLGWRTCSEEIIWFTDADCVAEPDALRHLLSPFEDPDVGGVGGSFSMPNGGPLVSRLIHEEIIQRHRAMPTRINFVATGNAAYRRTALEQVGGFDERFARAQDADLAYRVRAAGFELAFARDSRVMHFHSTRLSPYLRTQAHQGYWRVWLHLRHTGSAAGDSYSGFVDHLQPPLAVLLLASLPTLAWPATRIVAPVLVLLLGLAQVPYTARLVRRTRSRKYLAYAPMSFLRAFARGIGMTAGVVAHLASRLKRNRSDAESPAGPL